MKHILIALSIVFGLSACETQPMTPQQQQALIFGLQGMSNYVNQQQQLSLQRQMLYQQQLQARQPQRVQARCFWYGGLLTCN